MRINVSLLIQLIKQDFKEKYAGSILGIWWSFIWPLVNIFIYTVIFSKIMAVKLPSVPSQFSYGFYLSAGIFPWVALSNSIARGSNIFLEKRHIITKIPVQLPILPVMVLVVETIPAIFGIFLLLLGLIIFANGFSIKGLFISGIAFIFQMIFTYALALLLASFTVFIRDLSQIVGIILQIWFWFTPIVYTINILPHWVKNLILLNPAYGFIQVFQNSLVLKQPVNYEIFTIYSVIAVFLAILSYFVYKKLAKDIRDFL